MGPAFELIRFGDCYLISMFVHKSLKPADMGGSVGYVSSGDQEVACLIPARSGNTLMEIESLIMKYFL